jgi:hypothetical protein
VWQEIFDPFLSDRGIISSKSRCNDVYSCHTLIDRTGQIRCNAPGWEILGIKFLLDKRLSKQKFYVSYLSLRMRMEECGFQIGHGRLLIKASRTHYFDKPLTS